MDKLTTERLEELRDHYLGMVNKDVGNALTRLLAYEQAAEKPYGYLEPCDFPRTTAPVLPKQPVIPKQPEFYTKPDRFLPECLKPEEISGERRNSRIAELMGWFDRYYNGEANPKWLKSHAAELCYYILTSPHSVAQPVIPEQANILGYFSFDPEDGAEILKDRQTAIDNCNASIDLYRESMQEEYPDGWSDDVKRVCWGVIVQEARGFDAQGIPEDDPNHTYQTLDYRLAPDLTTAVTTQPVSEPYKLNSWISVADRLPSEFGRYLCYVEEQNDLGKSHYQWNCSWNGDEFSDAELSGRVTHWMPLPAAPAQESE